jgi:hypothetical protein
MFRNRRFIFRKAVVYTVRVWYVLHASVSAVLILNGQRHAPAALPPRMRPGTLCRGGWVGPRAVLDGCGKSCLRRDSILSVKFVYLVSFLVFDNSFISGTGGFIVHNRIFNYVCNYDSILGVLEVELKTLCALYTRIRTPS